VKSLPGSEISDDDNLILTITVLACIKYVMHNGTQVLRNSEIPECYLRREIDTSDNFIFLCLAIRNYE
jgi:hypothetical protein